MFSLVVMVIFLEGNFCEVDVSFFFYVLEMIICLFCFGGGDVGLLDGDYG